MQRQWPKCYLLIIPMLTSCGSGEFLDGFEGTGASNDDVIKGMVNGFDSIFVNGQEIGTAGADFVINDASGSEANIALGQIVTLITSEDQSGTVTAKEVVYDPEVLDRIVSIDIEDGRFTTSNDVMEIDGSTIFASGDLSDLAVDDFVEISGFRTANDNLLATYIAVITNPGDVELKGIVSDLDNQANSFTLGSLSVDFTAALLDPIDLTLTNGQFVEIRGSVSNSTFTASSIELEQSLSLNEDQRLEIEGVVTQIVSLNEIQLDDVAVIIDDNTSYLRGSSSDLQNNSRLEVNGSVNAESKLVAGQIEFRPAPNISVIASVDQTSSNNNSLSVLGREIAVTNVTSFADQVLSSASFGLTDVQVGDWIDLRGYELDSELVARHIIRIQAGVEVTLTGPIAMIDTNQQSIQLAGITVDTSPIDFNLDSLTIGEVLEITGTFSNGEIIAATVATID